MLVNTCQDTDVESSQRISSGRKAFTKIKDVLKAKLDKTLHATLFNSTILPAMLYASKMWATTKKEEKRLVMAQRAWERSMLGILLHEHIWSKLIQEQSTLKDITEYWKKKFFWAEHITKFTDNKWTHAVVKWYSRDWRQPIRRSPSWWKDEII